MEHSKIKPGTLSQYGILAAPVAFAGFPLYILAPDFYATEHNISLAALGLTLLILRLFDAIQDPLIGYFSDHYRRHLKIIMLLSALILCSSIYGLFNHVFISPLVWFSCMMALAVSAYSVLSINLNALGALWTSNSRYQTRIAAYRETFGLVGLVIAVSLPNVLSRSGLEGEYQWFSIVLISLMFIALMCFFYWHQNNVTTLRPRLKGSPSVFAIVNGVSRDEKKLLMVYLISLTASSIPAVLVIFFVRDLLGAEQHIGLFLLLYFLSGVLFMGLWKRLSHIYGNYQTWLFSMALSIVSFIGAFLLTEGDLWQYGLICILSGIALGADLVVPPSLLADQIHKHKMQQNVSAHYSLLTLNAKLALALASFIVLPLLEWANFRPDSVNTASALWVLSATYALLPCLLKLIASMSLWYFFIHSNKDNIDAYTQTNHTTGSSHDV